MNVYRMLCSLLVCEMLFLFSSLDVLGKECLEYSTNQRLNKEQLAEKCEGQVYAHQLKPVGKEGEYVESHVVGIVNDGSQKTHCGTHQTYSCTNDSGLKEYRMGLSGIEYLASQLEGTRAAHGTF